MGAAAVPMLVGSALGAATSKNPLQGAMLGGFLGGAGSALMPSLSSLGGASSGLTPGILPSAASGSTVINTAATVPGQAFVNPAATAMATSPSISANVANEAAKQGLFAGSPVTQPFVSSGTSTGLIPSSMYEPTFMERATGGLDSLGKYTQQNPVLTQMGLSGAQGLLQQQQPQLQSPGLMRGNPTQVQSPQYQFGVPQVSLI